MKTKEQIELAEQTIELLKDYIELAKVEKKLKDKDNKKVIAQQIEVINETLLVQIKEL